MFLDENGHGSPTNIIPQERVTELERLLEADYMPFYFHDMRTNEIISFNAFLETLSDGFSAQYTPTSGFGRIEKAQIYSSTDRSISLDFVVHADTKKDMGSMFAKINKLVTLVSPQWSRGTVLENDA